MSVRVCVLQGKPAAAFQRGGALSPHTHHKHVTRRVAEQRSSDGRWRLHAGPGRALVLIYQADLNGLIAHQPPRNESVEWGRRQSGRGGPMVWQVCGRKEQRC
jgi:hypothetical protein